MLSQKSKTDLNDTLFGVSPRLSQEVYANDTWMNSPNQQLEIRLTRQDATAASLCNGRPRGVKRKALVQKKRGRGLMSNTYFDDQLEIGPLDLMLLRKILADLLRNRYHGCSKAEELTLARELVSLFKSGFRTEEELIAMTGESIFQSRPDRF